MPTVIPKPPCQGAGQHLWVNTAEIGVQIHIVCRKDTPPDPFDCQTSRFSW